MIRLKHVKELDDKQENTFEKNLVWLFGSARGGTTWVATQLLSFQNNIINEPHIDEHMGVRAGEIHERIARRIDVNSEYDDYFFSKKYKKTWMFFLRKLILNRFFAQTQNLERKTIIKELDTWGTADIIAECTKNSRIIILLRDGRDVIDSLVDARRKEGFMTKERNMTPLPGGRPVFIKNHSKLWVSRTEKFLQAFENHSKDLRYMVKYEDLLFDTFTELKKLYRFIDVEISDDKIRKIIEKYSFKNIPSNEKGSGKFTRSATPGKWKENFSEEEQTLMNEIMGPMLKNFDYNI